MQTVVIKGPSTLKGQIKISGSKNASLPIIISTLLAKGECLIHNVPNLRDTRFLISILKDLGCDVDFQKNTELYALNRQNQMLQPKLSYQKPFY